MARVRLWLRVRGRVQGVGFRHHTRVEAERLGLHGWVRNLPDGSVEIEVEGEESQARRLVSFVKRGPPAARVTAVEEEARTPVEGVGGFAIR